LKTKRSNEAQAQLGAFGDSVLFVNINVGYGTCLFAEAEQAEAERGFW
jgi:hypothetical protein